MLCEKMNLFDDMCENCKQKFIVLADDAYLEDSRYFCFDTYEEAEKCFDEIETTNNYLGMTFTSKTAVILRPKEE